VIRAAMLALALIAAAACSDTAPPGTLGLPSARASTAPPTASPRASASVAAPASGSGSASASPTASASPGPSASGSPSPSPTRTAPAVRAAVQNVNATQLFLALQYSAAMRSAIACGSSGAPSRAEGAIDNVSRYLSNDRALDESIQSATRAIITSDCTTVTFVFGVPAPSGSFTVGASGMIDRDGFAMDEARNAGRVVIGDQDRPQVLSASSSGDRITIAFSEPMMEIGEGGGVTQLGNYRINDAMPVATLACADAGCRSVVMTMRPGALVAGRSYTLRVANTVDRAGRNIAPDPTTLTFTAR
jgi:hypothetical protein